MDWRWITLAVFTVFGPIVFRNFAPIQITEIVRGGASFNLHFSPSKQIFRMALKFATLWLIAWWASTSVNSLWFTLIALSPLAGVAYHFIICHKQRVHWYYGKPLA